MRTGSGTRSTVKALHFRLFQLFLKHSIQDGSYTPTLPTCLCQAGQLCALQIYFTNSGSARDSHSQSVRDDIDEGEDFDEAGSDNYWFFCGNLQLSCLEILNCVCEQILDRMNIKRLTS